MLAICTSMLVSVFLKTAYTKGIDIHQAILVNYAAASLLCVLMLRPNLKMPAIMTKGGFVMIALGILLPSVFIIMAKAVQMVGIAKSDVAPKIGVIFVNHGVIDHIW